jgi:hypothetical protein
MRPAVVLEVALLALGITLLAPADAFAYIDPGTGSYLFQLAIAGFVAGIYTIRRYWDRLKSVVSGRFGGTRSDSKGSQQGPHGME